MPNDMEGELKKVLSAVNYSKYDAAIRATKEEYEALLPAKISEDECNKLLKFVASKEEDCITAKYDTKIADYT
jgi:hypothetical protein